MCEVVVENLVCDRGNFRLRVKRLVFPKGCKVAVLGENGSGKTTFLLALAGVLPFRGNVSVGGVSVSKIKPVQKARLISYMPQQAEVIFNYTVFQLVLMGRYSRFGGFHPSKEDEEATWKVLEEFGLDRLAGKPYHKLSGGEKRRVIFARTINQDAAVLLLDEPANMMDVASSKMVLEKLSAMKERTVVAVLHDVNAALRFFERVVFFKNGEVIADVEATEVDERILAFVYGVPVVRSVMFNFFG